MSDQNLGALGADLEAGQTPDASGQPPAQQPQDAPKPLTTDDLTAQLAEFRKDFETQMERRLQSVTAKQENRIKKEFDARMQSIEAGYAAVGMQVPDSVRQQVANDVIAAANDQGKDTQQAAQPAPDGPQDPVLSEAHRIARDTCGGLLTSDPEYQQINTRTQSAYEFLKSVEQAAQAKAQRMRQQQAGPAGSAAPMAVQGQASGGDLMAEYQRKRDQTIQQFGSGSDAVLRLRTEYRRKGLNI